MKKFDPSHWSDDLLDRKEDAELLYRFLIEQSKRKSADNRSFVLNLDADWGSGKTFFIDRLAKDLENCDHIVVRINAWKDDYASDPYIAIMAAIDKAFEPYLRRNKTLNGVWDATKTNGTAIALRTAGAVGKGLVKSLTGVDFGEIAKEVANDPHVQDAVKAGITEVISQSDKLIDTTLDSLIKEFNKTNDSMKEFRSNLKRITGKLPGGREAPIFIIIDEVDRCRPTFAVQLLERIKHLFDVQNIVFIFGTNTSQLQHSIAGLYGSNFDGKNYLNRFFDRTYTFQPPKIENIVNNCIAKFDTSKIRPTKPDLGTLLTMAFNATGMTIRSAEQIIDMIDTVLLLWNSRTLIEPCLLIPLCINFYTTNKCEWPTTLPYAWKHTDIKYNNRTGNPIDFGIDYRQAYYDALSLIGDLSAASSFANSDTAGPTQNYVRNSFISEWSGLPIHQGQPSIQSKLLALVTSAGRITSG